MTTTKDTTPKTGLEVLQEKALHLGLEINDDAGKPLTVEVLQANIAELEAEEGDDDDTPDEEREYAAAQANKAKVDAEARGQAGSSMKTLTDPIQPPSLTSNAPVRPRRMAPKLEPGRISPELSKLAGLGDVTDADIALARHFDYPIVVPGARAYVTSISFNDAFGAKLRPAGTVVLLIDAHARNKLEHLTPVEDADLPAEARPERKPPTHRPPAKAGKASGTAKK